MRIREKLKNVLKGNPETIDYQIADWILKNAYNNIFLKSKEIAAKINISKSSLTLFSKKMNCEGYGELIHKLIAEMEFYGLKNDVENIKNTENSFDSLIDINHYFNKKILEEKLNNFAHEIFNSQKVYIIASSENDTKTLHLFSSTLNLQKPTFYLQNRKLERIILPNISENDLIFFIVTGLDIDEILHFVKIASEDKLNFIVIATESHLSKIAKYQNNSEKILEIKSVSGYTSEIRSFIRIGQMQNIFLNLAYKLTKLVQEK